MSDKEKRVIAYHEAGHALVGHAMPHVDPVHKVTIIPRGRALGYTRALPIEDKFLTRAEILDQLAMLLGGRAAEELIFHEPTTGAANDIEKATQLARGMVTEYGMSERLGGRKYGTATVSRSWTATRAHPRLLRGDRRRDRRGDAPTDRGRARRGVGDPGRVPRRPRRDGAGAGRQGDGVPARGAGDPRGGAEAAGRTTYTGYGKRMPWDRPPVLSPKTRPDGRGRRHAATAAWRARQRPALRRSTPGRGRGYRPTD